MERAAEIAAPGAPVRVVDEIARHMRHARPEGYMPVANAIAATDSRPWLAALAEPTLMLCGEDNRVTGADVSRTLADALPQATLRVISRAGHAPYIEQADELARLVRGFLLDQCSQSPD